MRKIFFITILGILVFQPLCAHAQPDPGLTEYTFTNLSKWYVKNAAEIGKERDVYLMNEVDYQFWGTARKAQIKYHSPFKTSILEKGSGYNGNWIDVYIWLLSLEQDQGPEGQSPTEYRGLYFVIENISTNSVIAVVKKDQGEIPSPSRYFQLKDKLPGEVGYLIPTDQLRSLPSGLPGHRPGYDYYGSYLKALGNVLINSTFPVVQSYSWIDTAKKYKDQCQDKVVKPLSEDPGNSFNQIWKAINDKYANIASAIGAKGDLPFPNLDKEPPVSADYDKRLYSTFFMSNRSLGYSDAYIYSTETPTYSSFITEFQITEAGLAWFWTGAERTATFERTVGAMGISGIIAMIPPVAPIGIAGALTGAIAGISTNLVLEGQNREQWKKMAALWQALYYMRAHVLFDECIAEKSGDAEFKNMVAQEEQTLTDIQKMIEQQMTGYLDAQKETDPFKKILEALGNWIADIFMTVITFIAEVGGRALDANY